MTCCIYRNSIDFSYLSSTYPLSYDFTSIVDTLKPMIPMIYNLVYRNRLIKEQEKTERQEAVRREREIRNQQLLEVSQTIYHFRVSFTFVSILLFHSQKTVLLLYLGYLTFFVFCPYVVRVACSLCVPYLYIYIHHL